MAVPLRALFSLGHSRSKALRPGFLRSCRPVTVFPQWPYDEQAKPAKPVGDPKFRWPLTAPKEIEPGTPMSEAEVEKFRKLINEKMWYDMAYHDWMEWERRFWALKERNIAYDETTYTLLLHGYTLSHRHQSENAYLVLEEMKRAETHPVLVRLNERLLNSLFELRELGTRPDTFLWRNVVRLCYHCSVRFRRKRQQRLQKELEALEPDEALALGPDDVRSWLQGHDRLSLPSEAGPQRFLTGRWKQDWAQIGTQGSSVALRPNSDPPRTGRRSGARRRREDDSTPL